MGNDRNKVALIRKGPNALTRKWDRTEEDVVSPVADIYETRESFILQLDMAGCKKESIQLMIEPELLTVRGHVDHHQGGVTLLTDEILKKDYYRIFKLGRGIDHTRTEAAFEDGVLTVVLPKNEEYKPKEIRIQ